VFIFGKLLPIIDEDVVGVSFLLVLALFGAGQKNLISNGDNFLPHKANNFL